MIKQLSKFFFMNAVFAWSTTGMPIDAKECRAKMPSLHLVLENVFPHRDGSMTQDFDSAVIELLLVDIEEGLCFLSDHPNILSTLIRSWPKTVFRCEEPDDKKGIENLLRILKRNLDNYKSELPQIQKTQRRLRKNFEQYKINCDFADK